MNFQTKVIILIVGLILFSIAILTIICSIYFFYALTRKGLTKMKKKILTFKNIPSPESFKDSSTVIGLKTIMLQNFI